MASTFKRGKVFYCKYFVGGKEHRKSLHTSSLQRARVLTVQIEEAISEGRDPSSTKDIDVDSFTALLQKHLPHERRPHVVKQYLYVWRQFVTWAGPLRLSHVTATTARSYKAHLLERYQKSSVRAMLATLKAIYNVAISELHCYDGANPFHGIGLPKLEERAPRFLTREEVDQVLAGAEAAAPDMHLFTALGLLAGLRKAEILSCRWSWFDFTGGGVVHVKAGNGFKTKSGRDRAVPMASRLRGILEQYRGGDAEAFVVFPKSRPRKNPTAYRVNVGAEFRAICETAGVPWLTVHGMRHAFASQLASAGVSLYKIGKWLGHSDPKTTQIYSHLQAGGQRH